MGKHEIRTDNSGLLIGKFVSTPEGDVIEHYRNGRTDYISWNNLKDLYEQFVRNKNVTA